MTAASSIPVPTSTAPYSVRLELSPAGAVGSTVVDVYLHDHQVPGIVLGEAVLDMGEGEWRSFLGSFLGGDVVRHKSARDFGVELARRLLGQGALKQEWAQVLSRRNGRPIRLELVLPKTTAAVGSASGIALEEIPFELMADCEGGFWFRRLGWSLVRTFAGVPARPHQIEVGSRALLAWANPQVADKEGNLTKLPTSVFDAHEAAFLSGATALSLEILPTCRSATRQQLGSDLRERAAVPLLALVAHGDANGGSVLLHESAGSEEAESVLADDLGAMCKTGGVRVAFLWTCHGARRHALRSSVVAALLDPNKGDLSAVVASHAALVADGTAGFVTPMLRSLRDVAAGDLERAVTAARNEALPVDNLQWAAPVYYARPLQGRSVSWAQVIQESLTASQSEPEVARRMLIGAPAARSWFRGREDESHRALGMLKAHRFVTLTGMPGIGKTALAIEISTCALSDLVPALEKGFWLDLSAKLSAAALREELVALFGFSAEKGSSDLALARAIDTARVLLVLDNAEELLSKDGDEFRSLLDTLLRYTSGLRLLLTSRRTVGHLEGIEEHSLLVGRLSAGIDRQVFIAAAGDRLAAERSDEATLDALVRALDGHPQSIVLVAGQVGRGLSLPELKARVEQEDPEVVRDAALLEEELEASDGTLRTRRLVSSLNLSFLPLLKTAPKAAEMFVWLATFPSGLPVILLCEVFGEEANRIAGRLLSINMVESWVSEHRLFLPGPIRWYALNRQTLAISQKRREELEERTSAAIKILMAGYVATKALDDGQQQREIRNLQSFVDRLQREQDSSDELIKNLGSSFESITRWPMNRQRLDDALAVGKTMLDLFPRNKHENAISIEHSLRELNRRKSELVIALGDGVDNT